PLMQCFSLAKDGLLSAPQLDQKVGALSFHLNQVLAVFQPREDQQFQAKAAWELTIPPDQKSVVAAELRDSFAYLADIVGKEGVRVPGGQSRANDCASLAGQTPAAWDSAISAAFDAVDLRQEHLFVLSSLLSLYHADRYGSIARLDDWIG